MKKLILSLAFVLFATPALADGYLSAYVGSNTLMDSHSGNIETSFDPGFSMGGAVGYQFGNFRTEGEVMYRSNAIDQLNSGINLDGSVDSVSLMGNILYDMPVNSAWVPYGGFGIGAARIGADASVNGIQILDNADTVFAYQGIVGAAYPLGSMYLTMDYRYFGTSSPAFGTISAEYAAHTLNMGVRF